MNAMLKRVSLTDQVANLLVGRIKDGVYSIGSQLPNEISLIQEFGVSRSTIRGAVKKLETLDYLSVQQGKGTFVKTNKSIQSIIAEHVGATPYNEVSEVRVMLEIKIVELAAERRTDADIKIIKEKYNDRIVAIKLKDPKKWMQSDIEFHLAVAKAARNSILETLYTSFMETKVKAVFEMIYPEILPLDILNEGHLEIIHCIEAQDVKHAASIMSKMTTIDKRLLK